MCFPWCFQAADPGHSCEPELCPSASDPPAASLPFPAAGLPLALSVCNKALPSSIYMEPGTPKKVLRPCSSILPRLDGAAAELELRAVVSRQFSQPELHPLFTL